MLSPSFLGRGLALHHDIIVLNRERNKMATEIYEIVEVELLDGSKIKLRPLNIKLLREFMNKFSTGISQGDADSTDQSMDLLIDCVQIAMKQYKPELAESKETLEDLVDLPTVYKIIEVASGIKLNDPKVIQAVMAQAGQN
jgi:hypothetical protein